MTAEYILAAVVIVMCYFVINGARQGFLRVVFSLLSSIIALFLVSYLTPTLSKFITNHTALYNIISTKLYGALGKYASSAVGTEAQTETINSFSLPAVVKELLLMNNTSEGYNSLFASVFEDYIVIALTKLIINVLSLIIIFLIIKILIRSITSILDIIDKIPVFHGINRLMGAAAGFAEGFIIISFFFLVMTLFTGDEIGRDFYEIVGSNVILSFIYNNNIFFKLII
ncbi:MAG: CvpA family protein [Lachnospiraceae bacterium]|nr:CvpA family protein [Lachnospiraceae bacterium]MDN4744603.1 CvpA family protein [Lachnospiraceae bacterium C1.1]